MNKGRVNVKATIPTRQYENIQPEIEFADIDIDEGLSIGMDYMRQLVGAYSEHGPLPEATALKTLKSFNEDVEINFDPIRHAYFYGENRLMGATEYIKKFYKPFDAKKVAENCEKSWGVPAKDIAAMWQSNGSIANMFGTVVHKALEHYDTYRAHAQTIATNKKDEEDRAMPKHPLLKKIVEDFYKLPLGEGDVYTEVLLTDVQGGYCGQADRLLVIGPKRGRIQDYKINVDSEAEDKNMKLSAPFTALPANKITKYQLQMSIYANILQKSGWTIEGLDAFVYEDEWKSYPLEVLNVI